MTSVRISATNSGTPVEHYWKKVVCGDRAGLALRADYRSALATAVKECGFRQLRQHGIFHDDMFVWHKGDGDFNFQYLFSNYDYYLSIGLKPFVELSFIPVWMASNDNRIFSVKCAGCPPVSYVDWHKMIRATVQALVDRYGLDEVSTWNFEVWNEPDIAFWKGTQAEYFELYRQSVDAVKSVDASLKIGGPATSNFVPDADGVYQPVWLKAFMEFCVKNRLPADFLSTHPYPTNFPFDAATGVCNRVVRDADATLTDLTRLRGIVDAGPFPHAPIHCNEWGSSPSARDHCHDHPFNASFTLFNVLRCIGLVDSLARWVFCDVSEEAPPGEAEFHGGWGLLTVHGIRKPGFHAYAFLNRVGHTLLHNTEGCAVFRSEHGWQILFYNHRHYANSEAKWDSAAEADEMIGKGKARNFKIELEGMPGRIRLTRSLIDRSHGWAKPAWNDMGSPAWPTPSQLESLHLASRPRIETTEVTTDKGMLRIDATLDAFAIELIEIMCGCA